MIDYGAARLNMVESQLRTNEVTDPALLSAFLSTPRERFVPESLRGAAYVDDDLPLGGGRHLMEPLIFARLVQLAEVGMRDRVLLVGANTGYGAAILSPLAASVVALESDPALAKTARDLLAELGHRNVTVVEGPLERGHQGGAPYHAVIFGGAIAAVPRAIQDQLEEGGRIAAVVKSGAGVGQATKMTRIGPELSRRAMFDAATPMLPTFIPGPSFVF